MNANERPWYFWPLIAFVAGLLIGLVVLGWWIWPVTWTNATIQDLRPDLRMQYVTMVADSYAQTRNLDVAQQRLAGWPKADRTRLLQETQTVLAARDPAEAANVQQLALALDAAETPSATAPGQAPATTGGTGSAETVAQPLWRRICTAGIFLILALGALVALVYLFRRWRAAREAEEAGVSAPPDFGSLATPSPAALAAQQEKDRPLGTQPYPWEEPLAPATPGGLSGVRTERVTDDDGLEPPAPPASPSDATYPISPFASSSSRSEPAETRTPLPASSAVPPATPTTGLQMLLDKTAVYQMGESDYDEGFDIEDPYGAYMGDCGLQLPEPLSRPSDKALALKTWLLDMSDPLTNTLVLMSEGAYRDTALRSQYSGERDAIPVRPGAEFELVGPKLLMRGRVERVSYAEAEPVRGVFAELRVRLTVYRRS